MSIILIPQVTVTPSFKKILKEIGTAIVDTGRVDSERLEITLPEGLSKPQSLALIYLELQSEVNEVLFNLNYIIQKLSTLPKDKSINRTEKLSVLRLFMRLYSYEFARMEDVFSHFLLGLTSLGILSKSSKREISKLFYSQFEPMIKGRNALVHGKVRLPEKEVMLSLLSAGEIFGRKMSNSYNQLIEFDEQFPKLVRDRVIAMRYGGRSVSTLMQMLVDTSSQTLRDQSLLD